MLKSSLENFEHYFDSMWNECKYAVVWTLLALSFGIGKKTDFSSPEDNAKEFSNCLTIALISHASQIMFEILQARLQQYVNQELPDVQAGFRKGRGTRDQTANICWILEKAREFQKNIYFCFIDYSKAFVWITTNCGKFFKRWEYQTTLPASWKICMQVKKQQLQQNMEQQTGSRLGKEYIKVAYCHPVHLTYVLLLLLQSCFSRVRLCATP